MTNKLGPVIIELRVENCDDCPFLDADESYSFCESGGFSLPILRRPEQVIRPPAKCPFRKDPLRRGGERCFGSFYNSYSSVCGRCKRAKKCKAKLIKEAVE